MLLVYVLCTGDPVKLGESHCTLDCFVLLTQMAMEGVVDLFRVFEET